MNEIHTGALITLVVRLPTNSLALLKHHSHTPLFFFFSRASHCFSLHGAFVSFHWISSLTSLFHPLVMFSYLKSFKYQVCGNFLLTACISDTSQTSAVFASSLFCLLAAVTLADTLLAVPLAAVGAGCCRYCSRSGYNYKSIRWLRYLFCSLMTNLS